MAHDDRRVGRRLDAFAWVIIVLVALALRVVGLDFGDPTAHNRPDEEIYLHEALYACEGDPEFRFNNYPPASMRWPTLWFETLRAVNLFEPSLFDYALDPMPTHITARWLSVLCGTATALLAGWAARRLSRREHRRVAGFAAAMVAACAPMLVLHSHFAVRDAPAAFFSTLALAFAARSRDRRSGVGTFLLAGLACGAAAATRYPQGAFVLAPLVMAGEAPRPWRTRFAIGTTFMIGFFVSAPEILERATTYGTGMSKELSNQTGRRGEQTVLDALTHHLHVSFFEGVGWGAAALAVVGLFWALRHRARGLGFVAPVAVLLTLHSGFGGVYSRYLLGCVPVLAIFAGLGVSALVARRSRWLTVLVLLLAVVPSLWRSIQVDVGLCRPEPRGQLMTWLTEHAGAADGVLVVHPRWPFDVFPPAWSVVPAKPNRMFPPHTAPERAVIRDRVLTRLAEHQAQHPPPVWTYEIGPGPFDVDSPFLAGKGILLVLQDVRPLFWSAVQLLWLDSVRATVEEARDDGRLLVDTVAVFNPTQEREFPDRRLFERDDYWFVPINAPLACERPGPRIEVLWVRKP